MKMKNSIMLISMGVAGTLLYQNIKNGNMKKIMNDVKDVTMKKMDDLEDMM